MILAGDIGGTKTHLAIFPLSRKINTPLHIQSYASRDFPDFFTVLDTFLKNRSESIERACWGVAGPVFNKKCTTINLSWMIDAEEVSKRYRISKVNLLNDLEATAYGTLDSTKEATVSLNEGKASAIGNRAVIAPGTGLGEATLYWDGTALRPSAFGLRRRAQRLWAKKYDRDRTLVLSA